VTGADGPAVRGRIATELADGGVDPARASVVVTPAIAGWGEPIQVTVTVTERPSIPFLGAWEIPLTASFTTRSEVTR
jgi:hypothetical protein